MQIEPLRETAKSEPVIVHLVHGTWPYGIMANLGRHSSIWRRLFSCCRRRRFRRRLNERLWFHPRSNFRKEVARQSGTPVQFIPFRWSGANSFGAREKAAQALRAHLAHWISHKPDACHLVVAHSHGGTVTVAALGDPSHPMPGPIAGILTMATPFVALCGTLSGTNSVGTVLRALAAAFAPFLMGVMAVGALITVTTGQRTFWNWLSWSVICVVALLLLCIGLLEPLKDTKVAKLIERRLETKLDAVRLRGGLQPWNPQLPCALVALRAPGDEASLVISMAQFVEFAASRIWKLLDQVASLGLKRADRLRTWQLFGLTFGGVGIGYVVWYRLALGGFPEWWRILIAMLFLPGAWMMLLGGGVLFVPLVILMPATLALAFACGHEVLRYPGITSVYAEPLPSGVAAPMVMLRLSDEERNAMALHHSLHELPVARERIAKWIQNRGQAV